MTGSRLVLTLLALAASLATLGARCNNGPPPIRFLEPTAVDAVTWMPLDVRLDMTSTADPASLVVTLNSVDVTPWFALTPSGDRLVASADDLWQDGLLVVGSNQLDASARFNGSTHAALRVFDAVGDPYADAVVSFSPGTRAGFGQAALPDVVLGGPEGIDFFQGGLDVLSLGIDGALELAFVDNAIVDGPGADLTVFENAFMTLSLGPLIDVPFSEPATVSVSQDGVTWYAFACADVPGSAPWFPGCAGVFPTLSDVLDPATPHPSIPSTELLQGFVGLDPLAIPPPVPLGSGGDSFDLADVGLAWAQFVRIRTPQWDPGLCCETNAGSDIDAVAAVHSVPGEDADANGVPDALE